MEKKVWMITKLENVQVGSQFRYNHEWCTRIAPFVYIDSHLNRHPTPKIFETLVVAEKVNCVWKK